MGILVIDDSEDILQLLRVMLERAGYQDIRLAHSMDEAAVHFGERTVEGRSPLDLILLDLMMPGTDGLEACARLKADPVLQDVPVIVVTARTSSKALEEAFQAGAIDFVRKPVDRTELLTRIRSALRLKQEMDRTKAHERQLLELTEGLMAANQALERLSSLDGLTEIPNRRSFEAFLDREWRLAARKGHPISLLMIDIDYFKRFNDRYGHLAGDDCLRRVAQALSRALGRPGDLVARYGGEEFGVILADTPLENATLVAQGLSQAVRDLAIPHAESGCSDRVTISLGVASQVPVPGDPQEALVLAADRALYQAKEAGRNGAWPRPVEREVPHVR